MSIELDLKTILGSYAQLTLFILMLSIGLSQGLANLFLLWRQRSLFIKCLLASFVVVPIAAIAINQVLPLSFPIRVGLATMAICPGAPMIYKKLLKGKASSELAGSYQITMGILAVIFVPIWINVLSNLYPSDAVVDSATIFKQVASAQLVPIIIGVAIKEAFSEFADDWEPTISKIGNFLLLGVVFLIMAVALPKVLTIGIVPVIAAILFAIACIVSGHILAGPEPKNRLTIAVANSTRNAGLALAIATMNFEDPGILGAIATYAVFSSVAGGIYTNLYQKKLAQSVDNY